MQPIPVTLISKEQVAEKNKGQVKFGNSKCPRILINQLEKNIIYGIAIKSLKQEDRSSSCCCLPFLCSKYVQLKVNQDDKVFWVSANIKSLVNRLAGRDWGKANRLEKAIKSGNPELLQRVVHKIIEEISLSNYSPYYHHGQRARSFLQSPKRSPRLMPRPPQTPKQLSSAHPSPEKPPFSLKQPPLISDILNYINRLQNSNDIDITLTLNVQAAVKQQIAERIQANPFSVSSNHPLPSIIFLFEQRINPLEEWPEKADATVLLEGRTIDAQDYMIGIGSCIGCKEEMKDTYLVSTIDFSEAGIPHSCDLFALFNGDQKSQASQFAAEKLSPYLQQTLQACNKKGKTPEGIFTALTAGFQNTHRAYNESGGTEAIAVCVEGDAIWIANAGTSRAFFVTETDTVQASEDAHPATPRYRNDIRELDGQIEGGKVKGILSTTRGIGYKEIIGITQKCCILPEPVITLYPRKLFQRRYLVLASHSLFKAATVNEIGQAIREMAANGMQPEEMSKRIVAEAIVRYPKENMTVMIIRF